MTNDDSRPEIEIYIDRARNMAGYRTEAADFIRRASSALPAVDADLELICRLWTAADEHDVSICDALRSFDEGLFHTPGQLDITRGAEPISTGNDVESLAYLCTWTLVRPEGHETSVVLAGEQTTGTLNFEVRDADGRRSYVGFPLGSNCELYEPLTQSFFTLHGLANTV